MAWARSDQQSSEDIEIVSVLIPICILADEFMDIDISDGAVSAPEARERAYQTSAFPMYVPPNIGEHRNITTLVVAADQIASVIESLESLFIALQTYVGAL